MTDRPDLGDPIPPFALEAPEGSSVSAADFAGKRLVLFFYPKDHTPVCTREACGFRDSYELFQAAGAEIVTTERTLTLGDAQVRTVRAGDGMLVYFAGEKVLCVGEGAVASGANLDWTLAVPAVGEPVYRK